MRFAQNQSLGRGIALLNSFVEQGLNAQALSLGLRPLQQVAVVVDVFSANEAVQLRCTTYTSVGYL